MGWRKDNGADGLPIWRGQDSIVNPFHGDIETNTWLGGCLGVAGVPLVLLGFASRFSIAPMFALFGLGMIGIAAFIFRPNAQKFGGGAWSLANAAGGLRYQNDNAVYGRAWSCPLDAVARVEVARTSDYTPSRDYSGIVATNIGNSKHVWNVPEHEWQVFLFMTDGARRVVHIANADRDDCAALAASIREYVERVKVSAPFPSTFSAADASGPRAAGFDL